MNYCSRLCSKQILCSFSCLGLGMLSGYISHSGPSVWYNGLAKPLLNPPSWVFAPVWTVLYIMMGLALASLLERPMLNRLPLALFAIQFSLNLLWTPIFFHFQQIGLALIDIGLLWATIALLVYSVRANRKILALLLPYFAWVSFAAFLNARIYFLNLP